MATRQNGKVAVWVGILLGLVVAILVWFLGCIFYDNFTDSIGFARICYLLTSLVPVALAILVFLGIEKPIRQSQAKIVVLSIFLGVLIGVFAAIMTCDVFGLRLHFGKTGQEPPPTGQVDSSNSENSYDSSRQDGTGGETNSSGQDSAASSQENNGLPASVDGPSPVETDDIFQGGSGNTPTEDLDHSSPIVVPESPDGETVISCSILEDFFRTAGIEAAELETALSAKDKVVWGAYLEDKIKGMVGTEPLPDSKLMNWNPEFTSKTSQANELARDIKENGADIAKLTELISLQKEAYAVCAAANLRYMLAQNYLLLAKQYKTANQWDEVYTCCLESLRYEFFSIRILTKCDDTFYIRLYDLAVRCRWIGDIDTLDLNGRIQAYYLSACLFEAASKNSFLPENEKYQSESCYYAGMANQKLLNLCWETKGRETACYLLDAYGYYKKSLDYPTDIKHKYTYLAQLCSKAQAYIKRYGQADGMFTRAEYEKLYLQYTDRGR